MKRISYIIAALLLLSSCEDFLSFDPLTQKTDAIFPQTAEDAKQMITGIYTTMSNEQQLCDMSYHFVMEIASDEKLGGGGNNDLKAQAYEGFMYSDPNMLSHNWETTYEGIHRANFAIEKLPGMDETILPPARNNQYLGEALFLRAFFYYRLVTLYGSVPLKLTSEPVNMGGAAVDDIYAQIASDLTQAIGLFPDVAYTAVEDGRANRWAAQAMLARVWLFYTGFYQKDALPLVGGGSVSKQDVIDGLEELVLKSGHRLVGDFHELWPYTNSLTIGEYDYIQDYMNETGKDLLYASDNGARNPESLFALKFSNFADWDIRRGYANMYQLFFGLRGLQPVQNTWPFAGGWGQGNSIPKQMVDDWLADEPGDIRLGASVLDIEAELYWEEEVKQEDGSFQTEVRQYAKGEWDFVWESNYWGKKYLGAAYREKEGDKFIYYNDYSVKMYGNPDNNQLSHADDLIFIRYADVLLMLAELNEDVQYINAVRERSGLAEVSAYSLEVLQKERRYELAFEGLRWNDMRRWGADYCKAALESQVGAPVLNFGAPATFNGVHPDGYSARYEETKGFYPIPQAQIDLSDGLLEQVAGYRDGKGLYPGFSQ